MFYVSFILSELRRRKGRTLLTALGLGVGVALVVAVTALSKGLDRAQEKVLEPLTGVGTDMSATRPLRANGGFGGQGLSAKERDELQKENGGPRFGLRDLGKPGQKFSTTNFVTTQLSFPASQVAKTLHLDGVKDASGGLTLNALTISGTVPKQSEQPQGPKSSFGSGGGGPQVQVGPRDVNADQVTVSGVDPAKPTLAAISPGEISSGGYLSTSSSHQAVVNVAYARRKGYSIGDTIKLKGTSFKIVGFAKTPIGAQASDIYVKLSQLQKLSDRVGRINTLYVRAVDTGSVGKVEKETESSLPGASVTTSKDLADRVSGSLVDAKNLASKLGTALEIVGLAAAFLIACLLTLSSVAKRIRELGTLKALGWRQRLVVRQVTGESLAQGALGGVVGAVLGIAAAAVITALAPMLHASVPAASDSLPGGAAGPGLRALGGFGQGAVTSGSQSVKLDAPVDIKLIVLAIALALLGGLIAGSAGALRAARLRPAAALRHID